MGDAVGEIWTCPHGFVTGFFRVPGSPNLIEHRSCGICCDEISEKLQTREQMLAGLRRDNGEEAGR